MKIVFIGAGKMATALAGGMVKKQLFPQDLILACDLLPQARDAFADATGLPCYPEATPEVIADADVIILAVKPQVAEAAVAALPPRKAGALVLSICAGITIAKLRKWFGDDCRLVRVMPNTPLLVGEGASCYALEDDNDHPAAAFAARVLGTLGQAWQVPENQLDAVTALSGSGPAYFFAFIEALRAGGENLGLPGDLAEALAVQTMVGAAKMLQQQLGTPAELRTAVTSKGGTTAAALDVMAKRDFDDLVAQLMKAAADRSAELGR